MNGKFIESDVPCGIPTLQGRRVRVSLAYQTTDCLHIFQLFPLLLAVSRSLLRVQIELGGVAQQRDFQLPTEGMAVAIQANHDLPRVLVDSDRVIALGAHPAATVRAEKARVTVANTDATMVPVGVFWTYAVPTGAASRKRGYDKKRAKEKRHKARDGGVSQWRYPVKLAHEVKVSCES